MVVPSSRISARMPETHELGQTVSMTLAACSRESFCLSRKKFVGGNSIQYRADQIVSQRLLCRQMLWSPPAEHIFVVDTNFTRLASCLFDVPCLGRNIPFKVLRDIVVSKTDRAWTKAFLRAGTVSPSFPCHLPAIFLNRRLSAWYNKKLTCWYSAIFRCQVVDALV